MFCQPKLINTQSLTAVKGLGGFCAPILTWDVGLAAEPTPLEDLETSVRAPLPPLPPEDADDSLDSIDRLSEEGRVIVRTLGPRACGESGGVRVGVRAGVGVK